MVIAVVAGGFWLAAPTLQDMDNANLLVFFVGLLARAWRSVFTLVTGMPLTSMMGRMEEGMSDLLLLAVPLFIFLGLLI